MLNVEYHADAQCPRWEAFISEIFGGDRELIDFVHRALGYSITGDVSEQVFFICYGTGSNGKSTLVGLMTMLLGSYATVAAPGLLIAKHHENHLTEIAALCGARFVPTSEVKTDAKWDEEKIKMLTGGDLLTARRMREDLWEFTPTHKFWIPVNHRPTTADTTYGFWRRVRMIPFTVTILEEKQDKNLPEALKAEMSGILAWLVRGCQQWRTHGLGMAKAVETATDSYRNPQNDLDGFINQSCELGKLLRVQAHVLFCRYEQWCRAQHVRPLRQTEFGKRMKGLGWVTTKISLNYYMGLCLKPEAGDDDDTHSHSSGNSYDSILDFD